METGDQVAYVARITGLKEDVRGGCEKGFPRAKVLPLSNLSVLFSMRKSYDSVASVAARMPYKYKGSPASAPGSRETGVCFRFGMPAYSGKGIA